MRALLLGLLMLLGACATTPAAAPDPSGDSLDAMARDYVALILEIGEHEDGYVDAYYGPPEWAAAPWISCGTVRGLAFAASCHSAGP